MLDSCLPRSGGLRACAIVFLSLVVGAACAPSAVYEERTYAPSTSFGLKSVAAWEKLFLGYWNQEHSTSFLPKSASSDSWQFYSLSYGIDGNTAMYRATGKRQYLDRALLYADNLVSTAKDSWALPGSQFKDGYKGWASQHPETRGKEVALYESYCWRYVTRLLRVIRETPELYANEYYREQYLRILEFSERDIFEKWFERGATDYIYRERTHMASHWAYMAMDLALLTKDATRRARYLEVFANINQRMPNYSAALRDQLGTPNKEDPRPVFWSDLWGSRELPGQDVDHGNGVVAFIVEAHDAGMEWKEEDIHALTLTLGTVIWKSADRYAEYVDGSGRGDGWFNDGFMKLGRYDVGLQRRLERHPVGNNTQFYGNAALNVRLLSMKPALHAEDSQ
jgi:hypothetical protein